MHFHILFTARFTFHTFSHLFSDVLHKTHYSVLTSRDTSANLFYEVSWICYLITSIFVYCCVCLPYTRLLSDNCLHCRGHGGCYCQTPAQVAIIIYLGSICVRGGGVGLYSSAAKNYVCTRITAFTVWEKTHIIPPFTGVLPGLAPPEHCWPLLSPWLSTSAPLQLSALPPPQQCSALAGFHRCRRVSPVHGACVHTASQTCASTRADCLS